MRDGLVVSAYAEVVFVQVVGGDELLAAELVGLAGGRSAKVGYHAAVEAE